MVPRRPSGLGKNRGIAGRDRGGGNGNPTREVTPVCHSRAGGLVRIPVHTASRHLFERPMPTNESGSSPWIHPGPCQRRSVLLIHYPWSSLSPPSQAGLPQFIDDTHRNVKRWSVPHPAPRPRAPRASQPVSNDCADGERSGKELQGARDSGTRIELRVSPLTHRSVVNPGNFAGDDGFPTTPTFEMDPVDRQWSALRDWECIRAAHDGCGSRQRHFPPDDLLVHHVGLPLRRVRAART